MPSFYNDNERYCVSWLENLITMKLLPEGEVNSTSIEEIDPNATRGFTQCHFFAGLGGWPYALRLAGWPEDRPIWTGSCPCQPFSVAGKRKGMADERHLWPHFFRLIRACRPPVVMGEQVSGKAGYGWLDGVRSDLEKEGYTCWAVDIPAASVDSPQKRNRIYWVAEPNDAERGADSTRRNKLYRRETGWDKGNNIAEIDSESANRMVHCPEQPEREPEHQIGAESWGDAWVDAGGTGGRFSRLAHGQFKRLEIGQVPTEQRGDVSEQRQTIEPDGFGTDGLVYNQGVGRGEGGSEHELWSGGSALTSASSQSCPSFWNDWELIGPDDKGFYRRIKPGVRLLADGVPSRVGKLRALGNSICPQIAAEVIRAYMDIGKGADAK